MGDILPKKRIGEILIEDGCLMPEHLTEALEHQKKEGGMIGQILIRLGYISEEVLIGAICKQTQIPYLPLSHYSINTDAAALMGEEFCRRHMTIIFDQDDKKIFLAVADPLNEIGMEEIAKKTNLKLQVYVATPSEIFSMLDILFRNTKKELRKAG